MRSTQDYKGDTFEKKTKRLSQGSTTYALVTPARNEARYLNSLIPCILGQTLLPLKWIVVSDGSTDNTDEIVTRASSCAPLIELVRYDGISKRGFGSKALAFMAGYEHLKHLEFAYIGNLDADITFGPNYYERLIEEMTRNPNLGVASGVVMEKKGASFKRVLSSLNHAVGAAQFWRRECFETVGGYLPVTVGGMDAIAELKARMYGWETRSFSDLPVYHHRVTDHANGRSVFYVAFRAGMTEYHIGTEPLFALMKALRRWRDKPPIISIFIRLLGYFKLWLHKSKRDAPEDLVRYLKKEQRERIRKVFRGIFDWR
ncbi:MAG: glycosyltransferase [Candidatus Verstraetearchaeota archaeon]|nr:glycosyltransferase [Candidatus Verstraetearchaeota archaeon]